MAIVVSKLPEPTTFSSFFGNVVIYPGRNAEIPDAVWRNLRKNNPDVQALLAGGLLLEQPEEGPCS